VRRRARTFTLVRHRRSPLLRRFDTRTRKNWPRQLQLTWTILCSELNISKSAASAIISASVKEAQSCGRAINQRNSNIAEYKTRKSVQKRLERVARCIKRASAALRRRLDALVLPLGRQGYIDLEVIEDIFDKVVMGFDGHRSEEPARTALAAMTYETEGATRITLKTDFSALGFQDRANCEAKLAAIVGRSDLSTPRIFAALASAQKRRRTRRPSPQIHKLIVDYVVEVAKIWLKFGLRPSRAVSSGNPAYKSRFHRFSELVLTAVVEPNALRHEAGISDLLQKRRKNHAALPKEYRAIATPALDRSDVEWLVSTSHVERALKRIQKSTRHTA
jgi:hypothetical protein